MKRIYMLFSMLTMIADNKKPNGLETLSNALDSKLTQQNPSTLTSKEKKLLQKILQDLKADKQTQKDILTYLEHSSHSIDRKKMLAQSMFLMKKAIKAYVKQYKFDNSLNALKNATKEQKLNGLNKLIALMLYDMIHSTEQIQLDKNNVVLHELLLQGDALDITFKQFNKQQSLKLDEYGRMFNNTNTLNILHAKAPTAAQKETIANIMKVADEVNVKFSEFFLESIDQALHEQARKIIKGTYNNKAFNIQQFIAHIADDVINQNKIELTQGQSMKRIEQPLDFAVAKIKLCNEISKFNIL